MQSPRTVWNSWRKRAIHQAETYPSNVFLPCSISPWRHVNSSNNDQAMITLTGLITEAFLYILTMFAPVFDEYSPFVDEDGCSVKKLEKIGRRRTILPKDCLGLLLALSHTRGSMMVLQLLFRMTYSSLSKYLQFARRIIIKLLKNDPLAKSSLPDNDKLQ